MGVVQYCGNIIGVCTAVVSFCGATLPESIEDLTDSLIIV